MGKRRLVIDTLFKLRLFDAWAAHDQLSVLTYHRIGDSGTDYQFDRSVFGPSEAAFANQMEWLAQYADPISENDLIGAINGKLTLPRRPVLVTFDDGYIDQYRVAAPILRAFKIPAIFFITTAMTENGIVGFWDRIARTVTLTNFTQLKIAGLVFELFDRSLAIRSITGWVKEQAAENTFSIVEEIESVLGVAPPIPALQCQELMTWSEISALAAENDRGFSIGSHCVSHRLLGKLSNNEQLQELSESKQVLEARLGRTIHSVAYPAGSHNSITQGLALKAGYQALFTFETGFSKVSRLTGKNIRRVPAGDSVALIACATSLPWVFGSSYYL